MARKNLAGLAALGALGMMMANKKGADRDTDTGVDVQPSYGSASGKAPTAMSVDNEFGDLAGAQDRAAFRAVQDQADANDRVSTQSRPSGRASRKMSESGYTANPMDAMTSKSSKAMSETGYTGNPMDGMIGSTSSGSKSSGTYRDLSGNIKNKSADNGAAERAANRAMLAEKIKDAGSSFGDYMTDLGKKEEKHGTYVKDGKVVRYAKGGMTSSKMKFVPKVSSASKRADGIATKGKTKGTMIMCGGGMTRSKK
jgi:hypothetical protein